MHDCYVAILYIMYTELGIQEDLSLKYSDTKFGKLPVQSGLIAITYMQLFIQIF